MTGYILTDAEHLYEDVKHLFKEKPYEPWEYREEEEKPYDPDDYRPEYPRE